MSREGECLREKWDGEVKGWVTPLSNRWINQPPRRRSWVDVKLECVIVPVNEKYTVSFQRLTVDSGSMFIDYFTNGHGCK